MVGSMVKFYRYILGIGMNFGQLMLLIYWVCYLLQYNVVYLNLGLQNLISNNYVDLIFSYFVKILLGGIGFQVVGLELNFGEYLFFIFVLSCFYEKFD